MSTSLRFVARFRHHVQRIEAAMIVMLAAVRAFCLRARRSGASVDRISQYRKSSFSLLGLVLITAVRIALLMK